MYVCNDTVSSMLLQISGNWAVTENKGDVSYCPLPQLLF
jgi:hypothetical protein